MNLELSQQECDLLAQLVHAAIREIGPEIRHSDHYEYKDDLKQRRRTLQRLYDRLTTERPSLFVSEV
jgi:hypothetical protein